MNSIPARSESAATPRLLDQVRGKIRFKHYSLRTEQTYVEWIKRFILHHGKRHPRDMGAAEVEAFLTDLAVRGRVAASTQNQAKSALLFMYKEVLGIELPWLDGIESAKAPKRLPVVLTRDEARAVLSRLAGTHWLIASLLYGTGLRLMECLRLRVKDIEFARGEILVRDGKGFKDRITMLPMTLAKPLEHHLSRVRALHERDIADGGGEASLPYALSRKYPRAGREWGWQFVFPSGSLSADPRDGCVRRHHLQDQAVQRAVKQAVRDAGVVKPATSHSLRHYSEFRTMPSPSNCATGVARFASACPA